MDLHFELPLDKTAEPFDLKYLLKAPPTILSF